MKPKVIKGIEQLHLGLELKAPQTNWQTDFYEGRLVTTRFGTADEEGLLCHLRKRQRQSQLMQSNWSSIVAGNERLNSLMNNEQLFAEPQSRGEIPTFSYDFNFSLRCSDEVASLIKVDPSLELTGVLEKHNHNKYFT
eukprot:scaffold91975_cov84-Cyclotella_meneghiniana.AAC.2